VALSVVRDAPVFQVVWQAVPEAVAAVEMEAAAGVSAAEAVVLAAVAVVWAEVSSAVALRSNQIRNQRGKECSVPQAVAGDCQQTTE